MGSSTTPGGFGLHSLGLRLVALLVAAFLVLTLATTWYTLRTAEDAWQQNVEDCGRRMSENILVATHDAMLSNHKEEVASTLSRLADAPGVEDIHIYDKAGQVVFSHDLDDLGTTLLVEDAACQVCHAQADLPEQASLVRLHRVGARVLSVHTAIRNEPTCATAACHTEDPGTVLATLDVQLSLDDSDRSLGEIRTGVLLTGVVLLVVVGVVTALITGRVVLRPVHQLIRGTRAVAGGVLDTTVDVNGEGELAHLAAAFNQMTADLRRASDENVRWSRTLEARVLEKSQELERTRASLVHVEKMASLGKLSATVAHELNNPLSGILTYAKLVERILRDAPEGVASALGEGDYDGALRFLEVIERETSRCGQIVQNLLMFSRDEQVEYAAVSLGEVIRRATMLISHHLDLTGVVLHTEQCDGGLELVGDANQLQQALVALMMNAVEAMPDGGDLTLLCAPDDGSVLLTVADTGCGIPDQVLERIFEPFVSTKDSTHGVGLGLAVVYGIVRRHHGHIEVQSSPEVGTTFRITLPKHPPEEP